MQSAFQLNAQLQQIHESFIQFSSYDPTTLYLNDEVFDRDRFKQLKKEGYLEVSYENGQVKRYTLSSKGMKQINRA